MESSYVDLQMNISTSIYTILPVNKTAPTSTWEKNAGSINVKSKMMQPWMYHPLIEHQCQLDHHQNLQQSHLNCSTAYRTWSARWENLLNKCFNCSINHSCVDCQNVKGTNHGNILSLQNFLRNINMNYIFKNLIDIKCPQTKSYQDFFRADNRS